MNAQVMKLIWNTVFRRQSSSLLAANPVPCSSCVLNASANQSQPAEIVNRDWFATSIRAPS